MPDSKSSGNNPMPRFDGAAPSSEKTTAQSGAAPNDASDPRSGGDAHDTKAAQDNTINSISKKTASRQKESQTFWDKFRKK